MMRAMILAAGRGERARPLSDRIPKPLFPVDDHPLIAYPLGLLRAAGIDEVIVNVHYLSEKIEKALEGCAAHGMTVHVSHESHLLETGGGIANAQKFIGHQPFIVLNADVVCDIDLAEVIDDHIRSGSIATMVLRDNPDPEAYTPISWNPLDRHVTDIRDELRKSGPGARTTMFTGIQVMEPTVFEYVMPKRETIVDGFYLPALRERRHVHGYFHEGYWADLGTIESYNRVRDEVPGRSFVHLRPLPLKSPDAAAAE